MSISQDNEKIKNSVIARSKLFDDQTAELNARPIPSISLVQDGQANMMKYQGLSSSDIDAISNLHTTGIKPLTMIGSDGTIDNEEHYHEDSDLESNDQFDEVHDEDISNFQLDLRMGINDIYGINMTKDSYNTEQTNTLTMPLSQLYQQQVMAHNFISAQAASRQQLLDAHNYSSNQALSSMPSTNISTGFVVESQYHAPSSYMSKLLSSSSHESRLASMSDFPTVGSKRRRSFTAAEKLNIIQEAAAFGFNKTQRKYHIQGTQISKWRKHAESLKILTAKNTRAARVITASRVQVFPELENWVYQRYNEASKYTNGRIISQQLQIWAKEAAETKEMRDLYGDSILNAKFGPTWISSFKKRFNLTSSSKLNHIFDGNSGNDLRTRTITDSNETIDHRTGRPLQILPSSDFS